MKLQHLFQLFILPVLLVSSMGSSRYVYASTNVYQSGPSVTTNVSPAVIHAGETALVTVSLNNVPSGGYTSAEFTCTYNEIMLEASNVLITNLFGADAITVIISPQSGEFIVAIAGSKGNRATSSGTAFTFNVKGIYPSPTSIQCSARVSEGNNVLAEIPWIWAGLIVVESIPSPAPLPTVCDKAQFIADITIPYGTVLAPGATFSKTWRIKNVGSCTWANYSLIFDSGEKMGGPDSAMIPSWVAPGQTMDITISLTSPATAGIYRGYWKLKNNSGVPFGIGSQANKPWWVDIIVAGPTVTPGPATNSPSPTVTLAAPTITALPSVTLGVPAATQLPNVAFDFFANACLATWISAAGQLPCPGVDGDAKGFMLRLDHPTLEDGTIDSRPGLLTVPQNINNGYIQGIYPPFRVQSGDRFRTTVGCEGGATNCYVVYRLDYAIAGSSQISTFWAFVERYEGLPYNADIDLTSLAGQDVRFVLTILSTGSPVGDRALWANPFIYRANTNPTSTLSPTTAFTPSPTSTPTIDITTTTTGVAGFTVFGKVLASKPVTINLYTEDNDLVSSVTADSDGTFILPSPDGNFSIVAIASGFLSARGSVVQASDGNNTASTITLPAGDIDNNNVIDQFDALTIGMNYNSPLPTAADLNNDGIINLIDLELLALNYHKSGPIVWQ